MMLALLKAVIGVSAILCGWLSVQMLWRWSTGVSPSQDALAGRLGCHGCGCHDRCKNSDEDIEEQGINKSEQEELVRT
jgi:hypothetical protein